MKNDSQFTEEYFTTHIRNDMLPFEPDAGIEKRLGYLLTLKQNKLSGPGKTLINYCLRQVFSRNLGLKTSILSIIIIIGFFLTRVGINSEDINGLHMVSDSSFADSVHLEIFDVESNDMN